MSDYKNSVMIEIVRWQDARSEDAWTEQEDLEMRAADITTVGFVVRETDDMLCIASSKESRTNQVCGIMYIPKECILERQYVCGINKIKVAPEPTPAENRKEKLKESFD